MITVFERLDLTGKTLERQMLLNQPDTLFVLPDNLIDSKLPRNKLHLPVHTYNSHLRPRFIAKGAYNQPIYDFNMISIPTFSLDQNRHVSEYDLLKAFVSIERCLALAQYKKIVFLYRNNNPDYQVTSEDPHGGPALTQFINIFISKIEQFIQNEEARLQRRTRSNPTWSQFNRFYLMAIFAYSAIIASILNVTVSAINMVFGQSIPMTNSLVLWSFGLNITRCIFADYKKAAYKEYCAKDPQAIQQLSAEQLSTFFEGVKSNDDRAVQLNNTIPGFEWTGTQLKCKVPAANLHWIAYYAGQQAAEEKDMLLIDHFATLKDQRTQPR